MSSDDASVKPKFVSSILLVLSLLCASYAAIAYQSAQVAAAIPFAVGGFDERYFWLPASMSAGLLLTAIVYSLKR